MANNYKNQLQVFKNALSKRGNISNRPQQQTTSNNLDTLDEAVFGDYNPSYDPSNVSSDMINHTYDANEALDKLKNLESGNISDDMKNEINERMKHSKIPQNILQSIIENPCIDTSVSNTMDEFTEKLKLSGKFGVGNAQKINEKLEEKDKKKINENLTRSTSSSDSVDMGYILAKMEEMIDKKFKQYQSLNEGKIHSPMSPNMKAIKMVNETNFLFLDDNNNIYECNLKYKGKKKVKK